MKLLIKAILITVCGTALSGCLATDIAPGGGGGTDTSASQYNQTISFKRAAGGSGTLRQTLQPGAGTANKARICFINNGPNLTTLTHGVAGINPLSAAPGGKSCANFDAASRVSFTLSETVGFLPLPGSPDRNFAYSMGPFEGGILSLVWDAG